MQLIDFGKSLLKGNRVFMDWYTSQEVSRYARIFDIPDFTIKHIGNCRYQLTLSPRFGYDRDAYHPVYWYSCEERCWFTQIDGVKLRGSSNPTFTLINELRGYTLLRNLQRGDRVIDAGASDGFITNYFAKIVGGRGRVIALEPDPTATWREKPANVIIVPACLSKKTGKTKLDLRSFGGSHMSSHGVSVESISLTELVRKYHLTKVAFIKLDIEGAELDVATDLLKLVENQPRLVVAIASYHQVGGQESWHALESIAKKYRKVIAKTLYPYHATTYFVHKDNKKIRERLGKLVSFAKIYPQVWPRGEKS